MLEKCIWTSLLKSCQLFAVSIWASFLLFFSTQWSITKELHNREKENNEKRQERVIWMCSKYPFSLESCWCEEILYPFGDYRILPIFHWKKKKNQSIEKEKKTKQHTHAHTHNVENQKIELIISCYMLLFAMSTG